MRINFLRHGITTTTLIGGLIGAGALTAAAVTSSPAAPAGNTTSASAAVTSSLAATSSASAGSTTPAAAAPAVQPPPGELTNAPALAGNPEGVSVFNGTFYASDTADNQVFSGPETPSEHLDPRTWTGNPFDAALAGSAESFGESGDGGPAKSASLTEPTGLANDAQGNLYIADTGDNVVREVNLSTGIITRIAGTGVAGDKGTGGPAASAELDGPRGVTVGASGDVFIADTGNNRIVEVLPNGDLVPFAGTGKAGFAGDDRKATSAELNQPTDVALDVDGNAYIADSSNNVIRRVDATTGVITTVAGNFAAAQVAAPVADGTVVTFERGKGGFAGDLGPATSARLDDPSGVALDSAGDLFITDTMNNAIREVEPDGNIFTVAGKVNTTNPTGIAPAPGTAGGGEVATVDPLDEPTAIAIDDSTRTLYITDTEANQGVFRFTGLVQTGDAPGPDAPAAN